MLNRSCSLPTISLLLFLLLVFAAGAHALDRQAATTMPSNFIDDFLETQVVPKSEANLPSSWLTEAMRDQIRWAKKVANLARLNKHPRLLRELRFQIKENEQALGASVTDAQLPKSASEKMRALRQVLLRATEQHDKCENAVKRLRSSVMANEDKLLALKEENKKLGRLAARTLPKGFHCLALQLTIQYYNHLEGEGELWDMSKTRDSGLMHHVIYTENVLAATAIINSTVYFAKDPHKHIFHILTDSLNYAALQMWFLSSTPATAVVEVTNMDNLNLLHKVSSSMEGYRKHLKPATSKAFPKQEEDVEFMKRLGLYYHLPRIFPSLEKVLVVDDDIVIRKDLSHLWEENLENKVIGAVGSCETSSDQHGTLGWACMNMVDLGEWRRQGLSQLLSMEMDIQDGLTILREANTRVLDDSVCHVIDLNDTPSQLANITQDVVAIHYRGYAKPWLGMSMNSHRSLWTQFVDYDNPLLQACNIHK